MYWNEVRVQLHFFAYGFPIVPAQFVEKILFSPIEWSWHSCQKSIGHRCWVYCWTLSSIPLVCICLSLYKYHAFYCCSFVITFEFRKCESSHFVCLLKYHFDYLGSLAVLCKLKGQLFHFCNNNKNSATGILIGLHRICRLLWGILRHLNKIQIFYMSYIFFVFYLLQYCLFLHLIAFSSI